MLEFEIKEDLDWSINPLRDIQSKRWGTVDNQLSLTYLIYMYRCRAKVPKIDRLRLVK
jgi:hypothetical protein